MAEDDVMNENSDMLGKRGELIIFLREVREKGLLDDDKYLDLRQRLDNLLQKCSAS
jgi:hypothetical protein